MQESNPYQPELFRKIRSVNNKKIVFYLFHFHFYFIFIEAKQEFRDLFSLLSLTSITKLTLKMFLPKQRLPSRSDKVQDWEIIIHWVVIMRFIKALMEFLYSANLLWFNYSSNHRAISVSLTYNRHCAALLVFYKIKLRIKHMKKEKITQRNK